MNKSDFTNNEIEEAKKNGFLLGGKTGSGKSTLLNSLFGKEMTLVKRTSKAVTQIPNCYYYKLANGKCISIIDSPGLSDPKKIVDEYTDNIHLDKIIKLVHQENINIKGILFLVNFQGERFDSDEAEALINYNKIFPLKRFWEHVLIIFTHHYGDPNGDTVEEMKKDKDTSNKEIFGQIMEKVKNVSNVIDYNKLNTKYINSYWPIKEKHRIEQIASNKANRKILEQSLNELSGKEPLFSKIEIMSNQGVNFKQNDKFYIADITLVAYFGLNDNEPTKQNKIITNIREIKEPNKNNPVTTIAVGIGGKNNKGELEIQQVKPTQENSYYMRKLKTIGIGGLIGATVGLVAGIAVILAAPESIIAFGASQVLTGGGIAGGILGGITGWIKNLFN